MFDIAKFPIFDLKGQQPALDYLTSTYRRQISRRGVEWNRLYRIAGDGLPYATKTALELGIETWAAAALPPLARAIAELVYWHVYLFENPAAQLS